MSPRKKAPHAKATPEPQEVPAGELSSWLRQTRRAQQLKVIGAEVPCGECTACCRSSLFIHIKPDEIQTLARIPKELLFPAPGLPKGHVLMGYDKKGRCPMFIGNRCSIYEHRPQTCRDYDCRIFAATGIELDDRAQALIAERARSWKFEYPTELDRTEHAAVRATAAFVREHIESFFPEPARATPVQIALLAIEVYGVFHTLNERPEPMPPDADIVKALLDAIETLAAGGPASSERA